MDQRVVLLLRHAEEQVVHRRSVGRGPFEDAPSSAEGLLERPLAERHAPGVEQPEVPVHAEVGLKPPVLDLGRGALRPEPDAHRAIDRAVLPDPTELEPGVADGHLARSHVVDEVPAHGPRGGAEGVEPLGPQARVEDEGEEQLECLRLARLVLSAEEEVPAVEDEPLVVVLPEVLEAGAEELPARLFRHRELEGLGVHRRRLPFAAGVAAPGANRAIAGRIAHRPSDPRATSRKPSRIARASSASREAPSAVGG